MNCKQFKTWWNEWHEGALSPDHAGSMDRHRAECAGCRRHHRRMNLMLERLGQWPAPEQAPAGLTGRLLAQAVDEAPARRQPRRYAVAATLLVGFLGGLMAWPTLNSLTGADPDTPAAEVSLAFAETETVRVAINAKRPVTGAVMTVELPPGVELAGYPGQRRLRWQTDLTTGRNELALPLTARRAVTGVVKARVEYEGREKTLSIRVKPADTRTGDSGLPYSITPALLTAPATAPQQPQPTPYIRSNWRYTV